MSLTINELKFNSLLLPPSYSLLINLQEIDPYSLDSLQTIMDQRLGSGLEFSVVVIKENNHLYFVEGSSFFEQFLGGNTRNPFTNHPLSTFDIYTYDLKEKSFKFRSDQEEAKHPFLYLDILYNDQRRDLEMRLDYLHKMGCLSIKEHPKQGYDYLTKAAQMGFSRSQKTLALLLFRENKQEEGVYWFRKYLDTHLNSPTDLIFLATQIKVEKEAFSLFEKAALMGNKLAIANVIDCYESGRGIARDLVKAHDWRKTLPLEHQQSRMIEFIHYLKKINYHLDSSRLSV